MIEVCAFKENRREGIFYKNPNLVANGRFQAWWPLDCTKLSGQLKVPSLWPLKCSMFGGLWKEKEKHIFHLLSLFTIKNFIKKKFPFILGFIFTMVLDCYFALFLHFH
jgi:hypothetical protein